MYIGIAGNIGSGKTSLTKILCDRYGWEVYYENESDNPYLSDFYNDMSRWSFNMQILFFVRRFRALQKLLWSNITVVQDRTIYEDAYIFADNLFHMGLMQKRDYDTYKELYRTMENFIRRPDLLIYLRASVPTLLKQIKKRNREYEQNISPEYLQYLNERYENWIAKYKGDHLIIDVDGVDYVNDKEAEEKIVNIIASEISRINI
ncbi:MAG: deoxynucleoside kinase [Bacteroidales bacterium]|jgi:deoxyadenosine/deoxycytidine kinase|nr:deoxynucleoside kinase [Bacteroidales bacterium]